MSPRIFTCALCGWIVLDPSRTASARPDAPEAWANQFRGLYRSAAEGTVLTGVGLYKDPYWGAFIAPRNRAMRWNDAGYNSPREDQFGVLKQDAINGRHGFIFHEACWSLLEEASHPAAVPLSRLHHVCDSLPVPFCFEGVSWGHDYAGVAVADNETYFPWEDQFEACDFPEPEPVITANPYRVTVVDQILAEEAEEPPAPEHLHTSAASLSAAAKGSDCFAALPSELRAEIAMCLPTSDVLSARLASRAFWPVFYSQQFWASRFRPESPDRPWLFEARPGSSSPRDWRWLYRRTRDTGKYPGLQNRQRIWDLIGSARDILALVWNGLPPDLAPAWRPDTSSASPPHRTEITAHLWDRYRWEGLSDEFHNGCRLLRSQTIAIPDNLVRLAVSTVAFGDREYIAGLSLTTAAGDTIRLGYSSSSPELSCQASVLKGFRLAVGSRGIQALQCINTGGTGPESPWLGCLVDVPRTERLAAGDGRIVGLEAGFDTCKMVQLTVLREPPPSPADVSRAASNLQNSAVWYPDVPAPALCLNQEALACSEPFQSEYKPLFWCYFGGPGGKYLAHLTNIAVTSSINLRRIDFTFDTEVPSEYRSFGRRKNGSWETINFPIDGPGGERIESIEMRHQFLERIRGCAWMAQDGFTFWCKLSTNRGRSCFFCEGNEHRAAARVVCNTVTAAPGTAITGFYATQRPEEGFGITALGVITEDIAGGNA